MISQGICINMRYFWITFQNGTPEKVMKHFVTDLVSDGSSADVRKAVYEGLAYLLVCEQSHTLLKGVLPPLGEFIHDESQIVRQAFISMLLTVKELNCDLKYWHITDVHNLAARLAVSL